MYEDSQTKEQWQLLQALRSTVEGLLVSGLSNVWNVYGGLNRLHGILEQIFKHGCRVFNPLGEPDCWIFIQGLNWLQPSLATSPTTQDCDDYLANLPPRIASRKDMLWLYKSLENHTLSNKLSWLLSDKEHLLSCLEPWAFLCQENLAEATLVCLRAVERNEPALLMEIDPSLFVHNWGFTKNSPKRHRRSSSYPINFSGTKWKFNNTENETTEKIQVFDLQQSQPCKSNVDVEVQEYPSKRFSDNTCNETIEKLTDCDLSLKTWSSLPTLNKTNEYFEESVTLPSSPAKPSNTLTRNNRSFTSVNYKLSNVIKIDYSEVKNDERSKSVVDGKSSKCKNSLRKSRTKAKGVQCKNPDKHSNSGSSDTLNYEDTMKTSKEYLRMSSKSVELETDNSPKDSIQMKTQRKTKRKTSFLTGSAPEITGPWGLEVEGQKDVRTPKKSFMEDGGSSVQPMATGYFPRPLEGQSLTSFLSSARFARANAELDRENAHFSISEAMIAAIEQVKCNRQLRLIDEGVEESDEEINNLKQRIRMRRRQRQEERAKTRGTWSRDLLSDGKTDTTTTDQSISPLSTSPGTPSDSISTDGVENMEMADVRNILQMRNSGMSVSMASLYSEVDLCRSSPRHAEDSTVTKSIISAEGVALSLISRFSEKQLPRASELEWLVSEQDAPQQLLPLPSSWPISPDEAEVEDTAQPIPLRGTMEWAPPRAQIIFTPHPAPVKKILIAKQNYRCAGCGMKVAVEYSNRFRYCEYLGRYFCTGCHTNQVALIPGKILSKWDFNRYPVSNFSYRLLDQMTVDPLFQVNDLNPSLYRRVKQLERTRILRTQLYFLKDFMLTCRFATRLQEDLRREPQYILNDCHVYSIQDFLQVKMGSLPEKLRDLVQACCSHVLQCELCQARGFVCELCCCKEPIFPWQLTKVTRCDDCGACFHARCKDAKSTSVECRRCLRLRARRLSREETPAS
ncbi:run domain Beclin-1-interacting and cysteine-rich domain-containing protein isoform X2 [Cephus cinctus]|uniref:Run domain Beclin-1-interacting and cysteine-rich domain-containing protein isoform X2 n=1 Tax=Cephus cinctus TaxID=211228 RepID=A0AAJ7CCI0_CEPCN|nr:run domain Beclin-1-interacting and cysteine-rich domain-containing protein isoform X2 [Cephus cinctus]